MRILLVEDQADLAARVQRALVRVDHEVTRAGTGPEAVAQARERAFDLVLLDLNLPGFDGLEVIRRLGALTERPRVLMLTARGEVTDRVAGLRAGADDYLTKPFAMEELLARVEAVGRRVLPGKDENQLRAGNLSLDVLRREVMRGGERIELSTREFELLVVLMREPGRVFSRGELHERIWMREHEYASRTVEIFITRLRKKLDTGVGPSYVTTVRGVGYCLRTA